MGGSSFVEKIAQVFNDFVVSLVINHVESLQTFVLNPCKVQLESLKTFIMVSHKNAWRK